MGKPIIPDNLLRCMEPTARKELGKAGRTAAEVGALAEAASEKQLHQLIIAELSRREILFIHARMDKRSTLPEGWPDFTVFLSGGMPTLIEVKTETGRLEKHQAVLIQKLLERGYAVLIVRSFTEFLTACGFTSQHAANL